MPFNGSLAAYHCIIEYIVQGNDMKQPPLITYNLKDRGRQHRGQPRNFNIRALCDSINGPVTQERIKTRAMLGYYGHKVRMLFGLEPAEAGVLNGKYNEIEPAILTTYLEAFPDGTVKHQTEFLDNTAGKKAATMYANRIGGFSSVIDEARPEMFGFDYVLDPNFSTNRGFALDSVNDLTFDQVKAEIMNEQDEFWQRLIDAKDNHIAQIAAALDSAQTENEQLLSMLSAGTPAGTLDSAAIMPVSVSVNAAQRLMNDRDIFSRAARLPGFVNPVNNSADDDNFQDDFMNRMGY